ncbi:replication-associated recombination protein A [Aquisalinus flavus]|uniref:Replication-associated recombination protein A n=1 Tax=Aquisalinus flavus TaxID=1526572 RepID=A0A8J2V4Y0_9PROT|nr:replication-associated recombination protein A [Aquisalinus flavus]MBD0427972.1 replication-associated recombination protein A [Aquisalinus flavus]UNE47725.1 replication-associated recombination protein A [Aquisalinus flavus]GGD05373.1 ATPase AAA [Aquisalinus flavus]
MADDLFQSAGLEKGAPRPLADRLRPQTLDQVVGQDHLLGEGMPLRRMLDVRRLSSIVLWGPPGVGKTTIARLLADKADLEFHQISAIFSGVADLRKVFAEAEARRRTGRGTLLFVDEIHRFNRAQQDGFLPHVESGLITLVGATTENPSFELNAALLSRAQVLTLKRLDDAALDKLLARAEEEEDQRLPLTTAARESLKAMADGDGRFLLNLVEDIFAEPVDGEDLEPDTLSRIVQRRAPVYDKAQEGHYNLISALHKSVRGSDPDAALYWLARMLAGGEDPLYLCRRVVRMASEDIGMADPNALTICLAAKEAYDFLGSPEGDLALAQAVLYVATAPKSNAAYSAFKRAQRAARETGSLMPPRHAMNAPTKMMKDLGYSDGYVYDHDAPDAFAGLDYFPPDMERQSFYEPVPRGLEKDIRKRLEFWNARRKSREPDRKTDSGEG